MQTIRLWVRVWVVGYGLWIMGYGIELGLVLGLGFWFEVRLGLVLWPGYSSA